jgi:GntR family transcriptional regulator
MANPMYRQIADDLRAQVESGELQHGQQLPTEIELRERHNASRNTVRDAIKWLVSLGLVETRPGQGPFVVQKIDPYITSLTADPKVPISYGEVSNEPEAKRRFSSSEPQIEIQKASASVAAQLGVGKDSQVISRHQRRFIDDTPWSLQTSFYPLGFVSQGATRLMEAGDITIGTVKYLADTLGLSQSGYRDWIKVRAPEPTEALFFNLAQDGRVGVFEIIRTAFDQTSRPMRVTVTVFPTDRNQFTVDVGQVPELEPDNNAGIP